jgi:branched-chain amino acid transport system substrate-binding protein
LYDVASEYNKGIAEVYKATLEAAGITLAAFESYTSGDKDFSAQITKIVQAGADSLFLPNYYSEVPTFRFNKTKNWDMKAVYRQ